MLDFNKAFSWGALRAKQKAKQEQKKMVTTHALASCEGKVSFDTFRAAEEVAKKRRSQVKRIRKPYLCHYCRKYHLAGD
jgi:hypothetical protein